jgi:hypothetical protein
VLFTAVVGGRELTLLRRLQPAHIIVGGSDEMHIDGASQRPRGGVVAPRLGSHQHVEHEQN